MNVVIHPVHFDASSQLVEFINKKLTKLETFFDRIVEAEVFLKLESRQNVRDKIVEIKVHVPGKTLFVTKTAKTFEQNSRQLTSAAKDAAANSNVSVSSPNSSTDYSTTTSTTKKL